MALRDAAVAALTMIGAAALVLAQGRPEMTIEDYEPRSTLVVPQHPVPRAKYPFIDVHSHHRVEGGGFGPPGAGGRAPARARGEPSGARGGAGPAGSSPEYWKRVLGEMDQLNMRVVVNLSGSTGERLKRGVDAMRAASPEGRLVAFANIDFSGIDDSDFGKRAAAQLEEDVKNGAVGLKIFKNFGMDTKYRDGRRVPVDDAVMDPVWDACARLKIPVLIHTGEPWEFFQPIDKYNERWLELITHPDRARPPDRYPTWEALMAEQHRMFERHPKTIYIDAHLGWLGNDLAALGKLLDRLPNVYTECGAVLYEFGRQPFTAHEWLIKYQDRVLFGKDIYAPSEYPYYFRVFETRDEYFDYYRKYHAFWKMYGCYLPDEVLKKIYYKNALKIVPGINKAGFPN